jgi:hypothetical protein
MVQLSIESTDNGAATIWNITCSPSFVSNIEPSIAAA